MPSNAVASFDFRHCTFDDFSPDMYVYCTSVTKEGAQQLSYEAGVRLTDPLGFGNAIGRELRRRGLSNGEFVAARCKYVRKEQDYRDLVDVPLVFQKELRFIPQDEFRFAWYPTSSPQPLVLEMRELAKMFTKAW